MHLRYSAVKLHWPPSPPARRFSLSITSGVIWLWDYVWKLRCVEPFLPFMYGVILLWLLSCSWGSLFILVQNTKWNGEATAKLINEEFRSQKEKGSIGCLHSVRISGHLEYSESFIPAQSKGTRPVPSLLQHIEISKCFLGRVDSSPVMKMSSFILATPQHLTWHLCLPFWKKDKKEHNASYYICALRKKSPQPGESAIFQSGFTLNKMHLLWIMA